MVYGSKKLKKKKTLPQYGIMPNSKIFMRMRCKGGSKDGDRPDDIDPQEGGGTTPPEMQRTTQTHIAEKISSSSQWLLASSANPPALTAYINARPATQGDLQGLWEDEEIPAQYEPIEKNDNTQENEGLSTDELTRRIYDLSLQPAIQPAGVGGTAGKQNILYGNIFLQ
jgi:hypothetical protein